MSQLEETWSGPNKGLPPSFCLCMAFSPDSTQISIGTLGGTIELWDGKSNNVQMVPTNHRDPIRAVTFSPDSKQIASVSWDTIWLRSSMTGKPQRRLGGHMGLNHREFMVFFSPNGKHIASTSWSAIKLWDPTTGELQLTMEAHLYDITAMTFSPEGKLIASGARDKTVKVWDVATGNLQVTLTGHLDKVNAVAFSPDSKQIASSSDDKTIRLWDVQET